MELKNPFLRQYLQYVEETETPRIMHMWAALSGIAACAGRRVYLPFGTGELFVNMYVLLVGPPGVRKSTAINIMKKLLTEATDVRIAPDDTAGKKQGLVSAIEGLEDKEEKEDNELLEAAMKAADIDKIADIDIKLNPKDMHTIYAIASEFSTFIGQNSVDMINLLNKLYDGEDYKYQLKTSIQTLSDPLMNIIGGTTPTNIADTFPPSAIGHGFTSRIILVFDNKKYKRVPRPPHKDGNIAKFLMEHFSWVYKQADGPLKETKNAAIYFDQLYDQESSLTDSRFIYYADRRQQHLMKLASVLALARKSMLIDVPDIEEANFILSRTEKRMPEALGEYGMSKISAAKQKMVDIIQHMSLHKPVDLRTLWGTMCRDMTFSEFHTSLSELENAGRVAQVTTNKGPAVIYKQQDNEDMAETEFLRLVQGEKDGQKRIAE